MNGNNIGEIVNGYSVGAGIGFLVFDIFFYLFLAWYCDNVVPQVCERMGVSLREARVFQSNA